MSYTIQTANHMDRTSFIYKVLSGKASETERKELNEWISFSHDNKSEFHNIKLLCENTPQETNHEPDDKFYDGLRSIKRNIQTRIRRRRANQMTGSILICVFLLMIIPFTLQIVGGEKKNILLKFEDVPLEFVISKLQDQYTVTIEIRKEMLGCKVTGTFYQGTADDMVRSIAQCLNVKCIHVGNHKFRMEGICNQKL